MKWTIPVFTRPFRKANLSTVPLARKRSPAAVKSMEARILHLAEHTTRMPFVDAIRNICSSSGVRCVVIPGINGTAQARVSTLGFIDRGMRFPAWREWLTGGEVGCLRSHAEAWADNAGNPVLILEDDMEIVPESLHILDALTRPVASADAPPTILTLTWLTPRCMPKMKLQHDSSPSPYVHRPTFGYGTGAYWCNARALVELRAHCPGTQGHPLLPVDEYLPILARAHPDGNAPWLRTWSAKKDLHQVNLLTLIPAIAKYGQNASTTHAHMVAPWLGCIASSPRLMGFWRTATKSLRCYVVVACLLGCVLLVGTAAWARSTFQQRR